MTEQATHSAVDDDRDTSTMRPCWSCHGPVPDAELFCSTCEALQTPGSADHFRRLDLERNYALDPEVLDRSYFKFQRLLHPDRFATKSAKERTLSLQHATDINDAYETLRDPLRRAEYLLSLSGRNVNAGSQTIDDPELLTESRERREALMEADSAAEVDAIIASAASDIESCRAAIADAFTGHDLDRAASLTTRLRYLQKLANEARIARARLVDAPPLAATNP